MLEWAAFSFALLSAWGYGHSISLGAMLGLISSSLFMIWGVAMDLGGAFTINIAFFIINAKNLIKSCRQVEIIPPSPKYPRSWR
jgi:hypothetical protein